MKKLVQYFQLSPKHCSDERVLEVLDFRKEDRAPLGLGYRDKGKPNQLWMFLPREDGLYEIVNKGSKKVLDDSQASFREPGGVVYQFSRHNGDNQQWRIKQASDGNSVVIYSKLGNFAIDVFKFSKSHRANIILWRPNDNDNQIWRLIPV